RPGKLTSGNGRREGRQNRLDDPGSPRRGGAPGGREERGAVTARSLVQPRQRPPLAQSLPVAEEADPLHGPAPLARDPDAPPEPVGRALQDPVLPQHAAPLPVLDAQ